MLIRDVVVVDGSNKSKVLLKLARIEEVKIKMLEQINCNNTKRFIQEPIYLFYPLVLKVSIYYLKMFSDITEKENEKKIYYNHKFYFSTQCFVTHMYIT